MTTPVELIINGRDNSKAAFQSAASSLSQLGKIAGGILSANLFLGIGNQVFGLAKTALDATASYERMGLTMETLVLREKKSEAGAFGLERAFESTGGRAQELLKWVQQLAINSPFDTEGVQTAFRTAMAYGFTSEQAQRLTQNMIDFTAGTGQGTDAMNSISLALGQVRARGKLTGQEIMQLVSAGVPVNEMLADMGFSLQDVEKGLVSSDMFFAQFSKTMESDFGGAAKNQAESWSGLINTLGDLKGMALREFFAGTFEAMKPFVSGLATWLQGDGLAKIKEWGASLGTVAQKIASIAGAMSSGGFGAVLDTLGIDADGFKQALANIPSMISGAWTDITGMIKEKASQIDWTALSQSLADGISRIDWATIGNNLILGVMNLIETLVTIMSEIDWLALGNSLASGLNNLIAGMFGLEGEAELQAVVQGFIESIITGFQSIPTVIGNAFNSMGASIVAFFDMLKVAIATKMAEWILSIVVGLLNIRTAFIAQIDGWQASIKAKISSFMSVGRAIVDGLKSGIAAGWAGLSSYLKGLIEKLVQETLKALGIQSPSKVFAGIGKNMTLGLGEGIGEGFAFPLSQMAGGSRDLQRAFVNAGESNVYNNQPFYNFGIFNGQNNNADTFAAMRA